jgi:branched-chain amino acid transport system substrate-binding protein
LMTFSPDPAKEAANAKLVAAFKATGYTPEGYTLYTYGAIQAWVQAVTTAGSVETPKVMKALKKGEYQTVLGKIGFDAKGDVSAPGYVFYEWSKGGYDYYK